MKVDTKVVTNYSIQLTEDELVWFAQHPEQAMKMIAKEIQRMAESAPKMLNASTVARPRINSKVPCPVCGLMYEPRGLAVHMHKRHDKSLSKWTETHSLEDTRFLPSPKD